ncbi:MAG: PKD domain-containing protein [Bacteroidetes bacterium]|jgi:hypothetical protein|nr:PKD domain-containing protein [Bacteroidota bacterium]MBT6687744.1 PKD domain-containing protein [Bacteroidota bacterium]MBT7143378.1 PKD domain-containing protein [Bacteroidota bacterium]MBT7490700.1 PKD domain-containing protein [Bacteroidota bacterium]
MLWKYLRRKINIIQGFIFPILILVFQSCTEEPTACFETAKTVYETGETIHFINCSVEGDSYEWKISENLFSTDFSPYHVFPDSGSFTVTLVAKSKFDAKADEMNKILKINNACEKFLGYYNTNFNDSTQLLSIKSGNVNNSIIVFIDDKLFCNASVDSTFILIDQQSYWDDSHKYIKSGIAELKNDSLSFDILLITNENTEALKSFEAIKINL